MAKFGRLQGTQILDVQEDVAIEAYRARYHASLWVQWGDTARRVPSGVQHGAEFSGGDPMDADNYLNPDGTNGDGQLPE